ncbi:hypothetical protein V6N11_019889 [Hibiscus sabdariffa]|uniref:Uncharacterized protein n=2 Tax=Hibiscus sabdariffa TaxID=183260 RepID=A0ABR1ZK16_9ROSI
MVDDWMFGGKRGTLAAKLGDDLGFYMDTLSIVGRILVIVATGNSNMLKRKSTKSLPASAHTTLFAFLSIKSFNLTVEVVVVAAMD